MKHETPWKTAKKGSEVLAVEMKMCGVATGEECLRELHTTARYASCCNDLFIRKQPRFLHARGLAGATRVSRPYEKGVFILGSHFRVGICLYLYFLPRHDKEFHMLDAEEGRKSELAVVEGLLREDLRNNSAWNHRWFVLHSQLAPGEFLSDEVG